MAEYRSPFSIGIFRKRNIHLSAAVILALCLFILTGTSNETHAEGLDSTAISDLYSRAKDYFRQATSGSVKSNDEVMALYKKSAMRYERIIKEGKIENGRIYYNLGNIYFRMNDIGKAILNYRRAEQYIPNDSNLRQNMNYARERRMDRIDEKQETKVLKTLFFWHYDLSVKTRIMLFTIFFGLIWLASLARIFFKRPFLFMVITISAAISFLLFGSLAAEEYFIKKTRPGVIINTETIARKGNSDTYEPSFREPLHAGTEFILLEERGDWYHVELADSRTCWVSSEDVEMIR